MLVETEGLFLHLLRAVPLLAARDRILALLSFDWEARHGLVELCMFPIVIWHSGEDLPFSRGQGMVWGI